MGGHYPRLRPCLSGEEWEGRLSVEWAVGVRFAWVLKSGRGCLSPVRRRGQPRPCLKRRAQDPGQSPLCFKGRRPARSRLNRRGGLGRDRDGSRAAGPRGAGGRGMGVGAPEGPSSSAAARGPDPAAPGEGAHACTGPEPGDVRRAAERDCRGGRRTGGGGGAEARRGAGGERAPEGKEPRGRRTSKRG